MTKQAKNTQENQATNEVKAINHATASSCADGLLDFVREDGAKLAISLVPDFKDGEENAIGLHVQNVFLPVENDNFANKLGSNLHDLLEKLLPEMMPQVIAVTMAEIAAETGADCDCSGCRKRREMEQNGDDAESSEPESNESTESTPDSI
nr:hypothetical protein [uncultured Vibrio sp.]